MQRYLNFQIIPSKMKLNDIPKAIAEYFDLDAERRKQIQETSPEVALAKVTELETRIAKLEKERAGFSLVKRITTHFDLQQPVISNLRAERDLYQRVYDSKK